MARNFGAEAIPVVSTNRLQTVSPRVSADAFGALTAGATKKFGDQLTDLALFLHKGKRKQEKAEKKEADKQAARDAEKARHEQEELPDARGHAAPQPGGFNDSAATMRQFATARDEATATNELATQLPLTALDIAEQERQAAPAGARGLADRVASQIADSRDVMISDLAERYSLRPQVVERLRRGSAGVAGAHVLEARAFEAVEGRRNFVRIETQRIGTLSDQATRRPASLPGLLATIDGIYASPATLAHLSPEEATELRGQARRAVTRAAFLSVAEQAPEKTLEALEDGALKGVAPGSSLHSEIETAAERSLRRRARAAARQEDLKDAVAFTKQVLTEQRPIDAGDPVERSHVNAAFRAAQPALLKRMMDPSTRRVAIEQTARFVETVGAMPSALGQTLTQFRGSDSAQKVAVAAGLTQRIAAGRPDLLPFGAVERETAYLFGVSQNLTDGHAPEAAVARARRDVLEAGPETRRARVAAYAMDCEAKEGENARYLSDRMAAQGLGAPGPAACRLALGGNDRRRAAHGDAKVTAARSKCLDQFWELDDWWPVYVKLWSAAEATPPLDE